MNRKLALLPAASIAALGIPLAFAAPAMAQTGTQTFQATVNQMNKSGVSGTVMVQLTGNQAKVTEHLTGEVPGQPHAQHFHFAAAAQHTCPTPSADTSGDGIVNTIEGRPAYGMVTMSLTTGSTATTAAEALDVAHFPTAPGGTIDYSRTVTLTPDQVSALTAGQLVFVTHGIDVNGNGKYDTDAGTSPLAAAALGNNNFPLEGTAPAGCGVVQAAQMSQVPGGGAQTGGGSTSGIEDQWALGLGSAAVLAAAGLGVVVYRRRNTQHGAQDS